MCTHYVNEYKQKGKRNFITQLLNTPDILQCFYKLLHRLKAI
jgi:hypothetical protein